MTGVLIVDDTETSRKLMRVVLEQAGFTVHEAGDGLQALEVLRRHAVKAVLSDVLMPRMDGYKLCHEIRKDAQWRQVGIILYTGSYNSPSDERLAFRLGADKYLKKPISNEELIQAVREVLQQSERGTAREAGASDELVVIKEYNEVLVTKLETKNVELEQIRRELLQSNEELRERTADLERAREELRRANQGLEKRVRERTAELENANRELESFSHSVSHDLRAPIRAIEGCTAILLSECVEKLDGESRILLERILQSTQRMEELIRDLLELSRVSRAELKREVVDLSQLAASIFEQFRQSEPERRVDFAVAPGIQAEGDPSLLRIALENLLGNAWKFTRGRPIAHIRFDQQNPDRERIYVIGDNGVGFEMAKAGRLFEPFQRLHSNAEFPGTGIGLATVRRIIERHGGRIWAESAPNDHTRFIFTL